MPPIDPAPETSSETGPRGVTPPPSVPLGFLTAAAVGLLGFGVAAWFAADRLVIAPTHPGGVSAAHTAVLAFLTVAVLGAVHQFGPVAGGVPLRSVPAARWTLIGMVATAWLLPTGFAHGPEWLIPAAGLIGAATVSIAAWNLSQPLLASGGGVPVLGLRISIGYLLVTVAFGVVYAFNREAGWFPLYPSRLLAHAHLGLLGWLGLTYVSVAEKLWPMFLLSHRPSTRSGTMAVTWLGVGVTPLAIGLLFAVPVIAWIGGSLVVVGLIAHAVSLVGSVRHRRRPMELLHGFLFAAMGFLIIGVGAGIAAVTLPVDPSVRIQLITAEIAALVAWLGMAVIGHSHKIVPFIGYTLLRSRGVSRRADGRPLLFTDLYRRAPARLTLASSATGFALLVTGILTGSAATVSVAGGAIAGAAVLVTLNLGLTPRFLLKGLTGPIAQQSPPIGATTNPTKGST